MIRKYTFLILLLSGFSLRAQEMLYNLNTSSPITMNPAYAGTVAYGRGVLNRLITTYQTTKTETSHSITFECPSNNLGGSLGAVFQHHTVGNGLIKINAIKGIYNYLLPVNKRLYIRVAVQPGIENKTIDNSTLFRNQLPMQTYTYLHPSYYDSAFKGFNNITPVNYFSFGSGILVFSEKWEFGCSFQNINRPNWSFTSGVTQRKSCQTNIHIQVHLKTNRKMEINLKSLFSNQLSSLLLSNGLQLKSKHWMLGLSYNHYQFYKNNSNYAMGNIGYTFHGFQIRYGMEYCINPSEYNNNINHSLSLLCVFNSLNRGCRFRPLSITKFKDNTF